MKKLRISKLFHWLYAILMLLPFGYFVFNLLGNCFNQSANYAILDFDDYTQMFSKFFELEFTFDPTGLYSTVNGVFVYLIESVFSINDNYFPFVIGQLLTYWTCISLIWLVFDIIMYVPMLVHSWIDKSAIGG